MKFWKLLLAVSVLVPALAAGMAGQKIKVAPDRDSGNILTILKASGNLPTKIETDGAGKSTLVASRDRTHRAYVLCVPSGSAEVENCVSRVFFRDEKSKTVYEIRGEELFIEAGRPIDALKWNDAITLSYERWASPHFGHRYVLNVKTLKQTGAYILSDR